MQKHKTHWEPDEPQPLALIVEKTSRDTKHFWAIHTTHNLSEI